MRAGTTALTLLCMGLFSLFCDGGANAQTGGPEIRLTQALPDAPPPRRRPRLRVVPYEQPDGSVYPRYNPGPDAVRDCSVAYVQEYRASGTVIVPHMSCYWRRG